MNTRSFIFFTRILVRAQISSLSKGAFLLRFYRPQFWRLQKQMGRLAISNQSFIGHNFGDYKNADSKRTLCKSVLSATILETTKTSNSSSLQDPRRAHTLRSKV